MLIYVKRKATTRLNDLVEFGYEIKRKHSQLVYALVSMVGDRHTFDQDDDS